MTPQSLRTIDMDDMIIMTLLLEGCRASDICRFLYLTPPAVTHRLDKYRKSFGDDFFDVFFVPRSHIKKVFSAKGISIAKQAKKALQCFFPFDLLCDTLKIPSQH